MHAQEEMLFSQTVKDHSRTVRRLNMTAMCTSESIAQAVKHSPAHRK